MHSMCSLSRATISGPLRSSILISINSPPNVSSASDDSGLWNTAAVEEPNPNAGGGSLKRFSHSHRNQSNSDLAVSVHSKSGNLVVMKPLTCFRLGRNSPGLFLFLQLLEPSTELDVVRGQGGCGFGDQYGVRNSLLRMKRRGISEHGLRRIRAHCNR